MNDLALNGDKRMTVKEVAEALNVSERVVQKHAADMGLTENGKATYLDEEAVTSIKNRIAASGRNDLANVCEVSNATTALDIERMTLQVIQYHEARVKELEARNAELEPKGAFFDQVADSKTALPMREIAAVLNIRGMGRNNLFARLRELEILDNDNLPYRKYQDRGYFRVIERAWSDTKGERHVTSTTLVYQRGLDYIRKLVG